MTTTGYNSGETIVYFADSGDAERVLADLVEQGVPESAVTVETSGGSEAIGFVDTIKEFFGMEAPTDGGALIRIENAYVTKCLPLLREYGGVVSESGETTVGMASTRPQAALEQEERDVFMETQRADVPIEHEEVSMERRPAGRADTTGMIEGDESEVDSPTERSRI
jgi:hypothetical protein